MTWNGYKMAHAYNMNLVFKFFHVSLLVLALVYHSYKVMQIALTERIIECLREGVNNTPNTSLTYRLS